MTTKGTALSMKIGGVTTPASKPAAPKLKAAVKTTPALRTPGAGSNAQTRAMENAISKTMKTQKVFGVPGAK